MTQGNSVEGAQSVCSGPHPLIIFDWSGVISNDSKLAVAAINSVLREECKDEITFDDISQGYSADPVAFLRKRGVVIDDFHTRYRKAFQGEPEPIPGAIRVVKEIAKNHKVVVFSTHPQELLEKEAEAYGLNGVQVYGSVSKQFPSSVLETCLTGASRPDTMYFGDTSVDVDLANKTKLISVGVCNPTYGYNTRSRILEAKPRYVLDDILEASDLVRCVLNFGQKWFS